MPRDHSTQVTGKPLATAGREQMLVTCPHCAGVHRHLNTGTRRAPCGATYLITDTEKEPAR